MTTSDSGSNETTGASAPTPSALPSPNGPPARTSSRANPGPPRRPRPRGPALGGPHRFGRVDPDGTVVLITSAGERVMGPGSG
jgi:hypothetical protein